MNDNPSKKIIAATDRIISEVQKVVFGQDDAIRLALGAFILGGHALIEGPPGVAKTLVARSLSVALGLSMKRIQFTPDLMPSDITGVYVFDQKSSSFRFAPGPIFADVILADEINRTPPKTQAALLQAMEEHYVTIDGTSHPLSEYFFVLATQNPLEHEGTFPLPEAQLDRFMLKVQLGYPDRDMEEKLILEMSRVPPIPTYLEQQLQRVLNANELSELRLAVRRIEIASPIAQYILDIAQATRKHPSILLGASPRAALHLALSAKLQAAWSGRDYVIPDDVKAMAKPVLAHRLVIHPDLYSLEDEPNTLFVKMLGSVSFPDLKIETSLN